MAGILRRPASFHSPDRPFFRSRPSEAEAAAAASASGSGSGAGAAESSEASSSSASSSATANAHARRARRASRSNGGRASIGSNGQNYQYEPSGGGDSSGRRSYEDRRLGTEQYEMDEQAVPVRGRRTGELTRAGSSSGSGSGSGSGASSRRNDLRGAPLPLTPILQGARSGNGGNGSRYDPGTGASYQGQDSAGSSNSGGYTRRPSQTPASDSGPSSIPHPHSQSQQQQQHASQSTQPVQPHYQIGHWYTTGPGVAPPPYTETPVFHYPFRVRHEAEMGNVTRGLTWALMGPEAPRRDRDRDRDRERSRERHRASAAVTGGGEQEGEIGDEIDDEDHAQAEELDRRRRDRKKGILEPLELPSPFAKASRDRVPGFRKGLKEGGIGAWAELREGLKGPIGLPWYWGKEGGVLGILGGMGYGVTVLVLCPLSASIVFVNHTSRGMIRSHRTHKEKRQMKRTKSLDGAAHGEGSSIASRRESTLVRSNSRVSAATSAVDRRPSFSNGDLARAVSRSGVANEGGTAIPVGSAIDDDEEDDSEGDQDESRGTLLSRATSRGSLWRRSRRKAKARQQDSNGDEGDDSRLRFESSVHAVSAGRPASTNGSSPSASTFRAMPGSPMLRAGGAGASAGGLTELEAQTKWGQALADGYNYDGASIPRRSSNISRSDDAHAHTHTLAQMSRVEQETKYNLLAAAGLSQNGDTGEGRKSSQLQKTNANGDTHRLEMDTKWPIPSQPSSSRLPDQASGAPSAVERGLNSYNPADTTTSKSTSSYPSDEKSALALQLIGAAPVSSPTTMSPTAAGPGDLETRSHHARTRSTSRPLPQPPSIPPQIETDADHRKTVPTHTRARSGPEWSLPSHPSSSRLPASAFEHEADYGNEAPPPLQTPSAYEMDIKWPVPNDNTRRSLPTGIDEIGRGNGTITGSETPPSMVAASAVRHGMGYRYDDGAFIYSDGEGDGSGDGEGDGDGDTATSPPDSDIQPPSLTGTASSIVVGSSQGHGHESKQGQGQEHERPAPMPTPIRPVQRRDTKFSMTGSTFTGEASTNTNGSASKTASPVTPLDMERRWRGEFKREGYGWNTGISLEGQGTGRRLSL